MQLAAVPAGGYWLEPKMQHVLTIDERRAQLEQLWHRDRYKFLSEYCRIVGKPANDPTFSLKTIINHMIDCETGAATPGAVKPR